MFFCRAALAGVNPSFTRSVNLDSSSSLAKAKRLVVAVDGCGSLAQDGGHRCHSGFVPVSQLICSGPRICSGGTYSLAYLFRFSEISADLFRLNHAD